MPADAKAIKGKVLALQGGNDPKKGAAYSESTDRRSWQAVLATPVYAKRFGLLSRSRVASLKQAARDVRFVPVDFTRDRLDDALADAGHGKERQTTWIWEGVVMRR